MWLRVLCEQKFPLNRFAELQTRLCSRTLCTDVGRTLVHLYMYPEMQTKAATTTKNSTVAFDHMCDRRYTLTAYCSRSTHIHFGCVFSFRFFFFFSLLKKNPIHTCCSMRPLHTCRMLCVYNYSVHMIAIIVVPHYPRSSPHRRLCFDASPLAKRCRLFHTIFADLSQLCTAFQTAPTSFLRNSF